MSRAQRFGGLFRLELCVAVLMVSCLCASCGTDSNHADFQAQGRICIYVDLQQEFDKTIKAVKNVLNFTDENQQEKLNHTIYKGLLNHMISQSVYPTQIQDALPKADDKVVRDLEEAGFVVLASLAKKDYFASVESNNSNELITQRKTENTTGAGSGDQEKRDEAALAPESTCDKYSPHTAVKNQNWVHSAGHDDPPTHAPTQSCHGTTHLKSDGTKPNPLYPAVSKSSTLQGHPSKESHLDNNSRLPAEHEKENHRLVTRNGQTSSRETTSILSPKDGGSIMVGRPGSQETAPEIGQDFPGNRNDRRRLLNTEGLPIIEDDLYWSAEIDAATPKGFNEDEIDKWKEGLSKQSVRSFEVGGMNKCGREKNRFLVLQDGSKLCARYRYPLITSMTGELYSHHLAHMLGLTNLPPLHISVASTNNSFWRGQGSNFEHAEWEEGKIVMLTKWIEDLSSAFLPETLVQGPFPVGAQNDGLRDLTTKELTFLLQWSDLILFDYLIAHFDRLTINLSSVRHYNDTSLMRSEVHNLGQHPQTKQLWIVDNESGLIDGYSFLLAERNKDSVQSELHEEMLGKICIFRRSTVERVQALASHPNPAKLLTDRVLAAEPVVKGVLIALDNVQRHSAFLGKRLLEILRWTQECQRRNAANRDL